MGFKHRIILFIALFITVTMMLPVFVSAMSITIGIPEKYSEVKAGEKVYFETEVKWPENVGRKDLRIEYSVKNKDENEVAYLKVLKAIETQASFMDSISIPESTVPGLYKISAKFNDYNNLSQEVIASFNVAKGGNGVQNYLLIIIGMLSIITLFVIMEMFFLMKRSQRKNR